jgi:potassium efflux system protein
LLLKVLDQHPEILEDPPVQVIFKNFGDNSLEFTAKFFIGNYERRLFVVHDLHMAIDKAFRMSGIDISFPQRDLHLKTVSEDFKQWLRPVGGTSPGA